jgi:DNA-binding beta-propeller fold protein YncE
VRVDKTGHVSTFYMTSKPGLSAAIGVLSDGVVLIGNTPTVDGTANTVQSGALSVVDGNGNFLGTFGTVSSVNGAWGMAVYDLGNGVSGTAHVFLSNVLSGSVSRFDITYTASNIGETVTVVAQGLSHHLDPAALVLGPSGLAYDSAHDLLYIANSADNSIYTVANAVKTTTTEAATQLVQDFNHLHGPLDITILPNGHLVAANSDGPNVYPNQPSTSSK